MAILKSTSIWATAIVAAALTVTGALTVSGVISFSSGTQKFGTNSTQTVQYVGTTDGCAAMIWAASNTTPTAAPTSTSFCN